MCVILLLKTHYKTITIIAAAFTTGVRIDLICGTIIIYKVFKMIKAGKTYDCFEFGLFGILKYSISINPTMFLSSRIKGAVLREGYRFKFSLVDIGLLSLALVIVLLWV